MYSKGATMIKLREDQIEVYRRLKRYLIDNFDCFLSAPCGWGNPL